MIGRRNSGKSARRLAAIGFAAAVTALAASSPARAESFFFGLFSPDIPPVSIRQAIERSGYTLRSALVRRGDVYLCDVVDRTGVGQRFIIDAHKGTLIQRFALPRDAWGDGHRGDLNTRSTGDDGGYAPRSEVDVPARLPYHEEYVNIGPNGDADVPTDIPRPHVVARGPTSSVLAPAPLETKPPAPPEKPRVHVAKPAPSPTAVAPTATATVTSASVDPGASATIVVPASTITPQPTPSAAATTPTPAPAASEPPKTAEAEPAKPAPAPSPSAAPTAKKSINDIPVAPLG
jgi:hypothetical protein